VPEDFNYARDVVDWFAENEPGKRALVYCNDEGNERTFTFDEISELSRRAAAYFMSLGIKKGDRVLTLMRRRWEYWVIAVAMHRIGAVIIPASVQLRTKDLKHRINTALAKAVIFLDMPFVIEQIEGLEGACPTLETLVEVRETEEPIALNAHDFSAEFASFEPTDYIEDGDNDSEFVAYFTSGTTSLPKMVMHNKTYPLGHIITARYMQHVEDNGLHLTQSDSGWAKFGWGNIYGQWICGSAILAYDPLRFSAKGLMEAIEHTRPTTVCIPPTMYRFMLNDGLEKKHIESVHWFATAGEPLSPEVNERFENLCGLPIREGFGQSEGTPITCSFEWLKVRPGSMGKPSALYHVSIVDKDGKPCKTGEAGEIIIDTTKSEHGSVGLLMGYMDGHTLTPAHDGIYHTNDVAYADEKGYYWFVGRNDDVIKCSGYRISPFEIESVLNAHEAVKESAIVGRPDPIRGQVVCAIISLKPGYEPSDELTKELQTYVKTNTAPYKYPRIVEYVDELPKTVTGKIIRKGL